MCRQAQRCDKSHVGFGNPATLAHLRCRPEALRPCLSAGLPSMSSRHNLPTLQGAFVTSTDTKICEFLVNPPRPCGSRKNRWPTLQCMESLPADCSKFCRPPRGQAWLSAHQTKYHCHAPYWKTRTIATVQVAPGAQMNTDRHPLRLEHHHALEESA